MQTEEQTVLDGTNQPKATEEVNNHENMMEEDEDDNHEDQALDIKAKSHMVEDFEITVFKEEVGCIHEIVMPKGCKRGSNILSFILD